MMNRQQLGEEEEEYACRYEGCKRKYKSKFSLKRHYLSHMGVRNHKCPYCNKGFSLAQYLREHIHIHTGEKPFVCPFPGCGKQFRQAGKLSIHRKEHNMVSIPESGSDQTVNSCEAISNLRAVEAVFQQLETMSIPYYFYTRALPMPQQITTQPAVVETLHHQYANWMARHVVTKFVHPRPAEQFN